MKRSLLPTNMRCMVTLGIDFDGPGYEIGRGTAPAGIHSWGRYSARCGVPRLLDVLDRQQVPCTFFVPGYDAETHPDVVQEIVRRGHEVAAHGYLHESWDLTAEEEAGLLEKTDGILRELIGRPVLGWRSPSGRKTLETMKVLKRLGYLYDSSDKDYDLPYRIRYGEGEDDCLIELPTNTYSLDDFPFYRFSYTPPSEVLAQWKSEFDAIYAGDRYFLLMIHPRSGWGSGTPARARIFEEMIRYIKSHDGVQFFSASGCAQWCHEHPTCLEEMRTL